MTEERRDKIGLFFMGFGLGLLLTFILCLVDAAHRNRQWMRVLEENGIGIPSSPPPAPR